MTPLTVPTILPLPHFDPVAIKRSLVEDLHLGPEDPRFFDGPNNRLCILPIPLPLRPLNPIIY